MTTFTPTHDVVTEATAAGFFPPRHNVEITQVTELTDRVMRLTFRDPFIASHAKPAQFVNLFTHDDFMLMPRPFGVSEVDGDEVSVIFAVVGHGTEQLAGLQAGDTVDVLGPLGRGFNLKEDANYILVGGGLGVPPLIYAAQKLAEHDASFATAVFGYRNDHFAEEYVSRYADWSWSIDDAEGNVVDLLNKLEQGDDLKAYDRKPIILSCGPLPMMKAVADWAAERGIPAQLSMEQRMGCGYGTCVLCTIDTVDGRLKVCSDGPVFTREQLGWGEVTMSANNQSAQGGDNHINLYEPHVWKHHTKVAGLEWKNPVGTASGTFQYAAVRWFYDVSQLGAVCTKGASPVPWEGNPSPRTAESPAANINAVGLQNPGIDHYLAEDLPKLKAAGAFVISNVAGHCDDDYAAVVEKLADSDADMLEINVSCPNVSAGGMSVGTDPVALANLMDRLRPMTDKPMIVKLTPNVTDITVPARAAVEHGADALSMINTLKGMRINIRTGKPIIANVTGGVSGPAVLPVGLAAVYRVRTALPEIPIIGLGGIDSGEKALEYLYAGANAVEVGAAALFDPVAPLRVARELDDLLDSRPELAAKLAAGQTWR